MRFATAEEGKTKHCCKTQSAEAESLLTENDNQTFLQIPKDILGLEEEKVI